MKTIILKYLLIFLSGIFLASCQDYLEKTPEAEISEDDIFSTYISFQGFMDANYAEIIDNVNIQVGMSMHWGGEVHGSTNWHVHQVNDGNYWILITSVFSPYKHLYQRYGDYQKTRGYWSGGWRGVRNCNIALEKLPLLKDATEEEKRLIEGQALFFRAYFHGEIIASFGGMPYIDEVLSPDDEMRLPRLTYQETTDKIVADLDKAIALLPADWDFTVVGAERIGANAGKITKGTALAYKQKFLLYAGSPLMNGFSGGSFTYNEEYCKRAAAAGWEMIKLANSLLPNGKTVYTLVPMAEYQDNFTKNDRTIPWTDETILARIHNTFGAANYNNPVRRGYIPQYLSGNPHGHWANQLFVDRFEMADGTRYKVEYDTDDDKRWKNRDPRFEKNFYVDREKCGNHARSVINLHYGAGNTTRPGNLVELAYLLKKYWRFGVNQFDRQFTQLSLTQPKMRLAQVYLDYAEAVTAAYGPNGKAPGADLTAVDAINIVRTRAGMPPVTSAAVGYDSFMELVWNERSVELAFECHYWFDIRRWYVAHLPEYKDIVDLEFDKDWTYFNRKVFKTRVFDNPKHYWMPIYRDQALLYEGMYQNPGW